MKRFLDIKFLYLILALATVVFLAECGLKALTVDVPASGNANEAVTFTLHCGAEPRIQSGTYTTNLLVGIMVPRNWNARASTVVNFTSPKGNGVMSRIPDSEVEPASGLSWPDAAKKRFGIGPNLIDDFEWIIYRSTSAYTFSNNEDIDFDVKVTTKLGSENMFLKLGFYVGSSKENLRSDDVDYTKFAFSNLFEVKNGIGDLVDLVNPQLSKVEPVKSTDNDIMTFTFDSGVINTNLNNIDNIYLCAKAFDANGGVTDVCEQTAKTKLTAIGGKRYRIDFWPRAFFNVGAGKTLTRIEYYFTDATGTKKVGYGNTADPFKFTFKCQ
jgi:hypothetical protein